MTSIQTLQCLHYDDRAGHVEFSAEYMDALLAWREREPTPAMPSALAARGRAEVRDTPVSVEAAALMRRLCLAFLKDPAS